jgi:hypothetical protein
VRRRVFAVLATAGVALVLAACGSNDNGGATTTAGGGTPGY